MGRYGGFELSYGSDADVMFVHDPVAGRRPAGRGDVRHRGRQRAAPAARPARRPTRRSRSTPTCARRASRGRWCGPSLVRRLLREVVEGLGVRRRCCAPTPSSATRQVRRRFTELIDPLRYPAAGITDDDVVEVRRIKARVDHERLPRGADPHTHLKLGRGGLADIEWTVQLLQMRHAGRCPGCARRGPSTPWARPARPVCSPPTTPTCWPRSWRMVSRVAQAQRPAAARPADQGRDGATSSATRTAAATRWSTTTCDHARARAVVDRVFWG